MNTNLKRSLALLLLLAAPTLSLAQDQKTCIECRKKALVRFQLCMLNAGKTQPARDECSKYMDVETKTCSEGACNY